MTELPARAEQAARHWFAGEAAGAADASRAVASLPSISPAAVRAAFDRRQRRRFVSLLAAAAVVVAALMITPLALRPTDLPIAGIPAPSAEPVRTTTATPTNSTRAPSGGLPGKVFHGTPQEYNDARMACVAGYGLVVVPGDPNDSPSFGVSSEGVGQDRVDEVLARCDADVGTLHTPPATQATVAEEYDWLVGQYRCLVAAGFAAKEPPSLEEFLEQWGTRNHISYDPLSTLMDQYDAALAACPRTTESWPRR